MAKYPSEMFGYPYSNKTSKADDAGSFAGRDEKKVMAEVLNRRIHVRGIGERAVAAHHVRVTA